MSDEQASFEVVLKDRTRKDAVSAAKSFRLVHRAAEGKGLGISGGLRKGEQALLSTERALKKTERAAVSFGRKTRKVNPFGSFSANTAVFRSSEHAGRMWDEMKRGHVQYAAVQAKVRLKQKRQAAVEAKRSRKEDALGLGGFGKIGRLGRLGHPALIAAGAATIGSGIAAYETGKATLSAVRYRDEVLTGLKLITKSARGANAVFEDSLKLSDDLGQDWRSTVGGMQKLLAKGFSQDTATDLTKGLADLSIVSPDANTDNLLLAIGQIKTAGKLQGDELNQLTEAGLNSSLMFDQLQKRLGKSRTEVLKLKESGKLLAEDVLPAILDSIQAMTGKELGQAAKEANDTIAGQMRKLEQLPGRFFVAVANELESKKLDGALGSLLESLDPDSAAFATGVTAVADAMEFAAETFQVAIPLAKEFGSGFAEAFTSLAGIETNEDLFAAFKDPDTLNTVREWGEALGRIVVLLGQVVELGSKAVSFVNDMPSLPFVGETAELGTGAVSDALRGANQGMKELLAGEDFFPIITIAETVVDGFVERLRGGIPAIQSASADMGEAAIGSLKASVDANSPSRKAGKIGAWTAEGMVQGIDQRLPMVERSGATLGSATLSGLRSSASQLPDVVAGGGAGAAGRGTAVQVGDITLQLSNLPTDATKNPEELARFIRRELMNALLGVVETGTIE